MTRTVKLCLIPAAAAAALSLTLSGCAQSRVNAAPAMGSDAVAGMHVWRDNGCYACHAFGGTLGGPDLAGVLERRDNDWLRKWMKETSTMLQSDPQAIAMMKDFRGQRMPQFKLSDRQIDALFKFFAQETARVRGGTSGGTN
jgi:mono/diheme cytochrome c family protein